MDEKLADDAEDAMKALATQGVLQRLAKEAVNMTLEAGKKFTLFNLVDALTRLAREIPFAGDRAEADERASKLLALES
jgi:hypothetical protein